MNQYALLKGRLSATLRDGWTIMILLLSVFLSIFLASNSVRKDAGHFRMGIVDRDHGELVEDMLHTLHQEYKIDTVILTEEEADRQLSLHQLECYVVITDGFTERLKNLDFDQLLTLYIRPDSNYSTSITTPLIAEVLKTWIEEKVIVELKTITDISPEEEADIRNRYKTIWDNGSQIEILMHPVEESVEHSKMELSRPIYTWQASAWYAMLACFYICVSGRWMSDFRNHDFLLRARQRGCGIAGLFFPQAVPDILLVTIGYLPVCVLEQGLSIQEHRVIFSFSLCSSNISTILIRLLVFFLYSIAVMGMSLIICASCKHLSTLLFMAPFVSVFSSIYAGLIVDLPEWTSFLKHFTRILPGYYYGKIVKYEMPPMQAFQYIGCTCIIAAAWIILSILYIHVITPVSKKR